MITAIELDKFFSARVSPGKTDGAHGSLGTGIYHSDHLDGRHYVNNGLCHCHFQFCWRTVTCPLGKPFFNCGDYRWMGMAQYHRSPRAHIVYILIFVHIPDQGSICSGNKGRVHANRLSCPYRAVHAAGDVSLSFFKKDFRLFSHDFSPKNISCLFF